MTADSIPDGERVYPSMYCIAPMATIGMSTNWWIPMNDVMG